MTVAATAPTPSIQNRGRLTIAEGVIEKIAGQVAAEVSGTYGRSGGLLGMGTTEDPSARPGVTAHLSSDSVDLDLTLGVAYPTSIRAATDAVRQAVRTRVTQLTGVEVHRVDIDVTFLTNTDSADVRSLR